MKTALFISPHLDDVAFSCGGSLARLAGEGWRTILCTVFTKSVGNPRGFALACQLDKGLGAEIDYMKLRRAEDFRAAKILAAAEVLHLNFAEAPHRGYESAPELFAGVKNEDSIWISVAEHLQLLDDIHCPEMVFAPQGLGNHADHLQVVRAAAAVFKREKTRLYREAPYAIRQPDAAASPLWSHPTTETYYEIKTQLKPKIAACAAYASQINFQFGGVPKLEKELAAFHENEAKRVKANSTAVETFLSTKN